jgi:glyoxylase-like metal-dependent hydrolase (beta-lactamase superfamily II)
MIVVSVLALGLVRPGIAASPSTPEPAPKDLGHGTWLISGSVMPDREPDGNTVVFEAPQGLVVADTGRHAWHRQAILALAETRDRRIVAVINTHWHLDHVSGNPAVRAAFPGLRVHASDAIDGALAGFLATSARESASYVDDPRLPATLREDIRGDIRTIENGAALRPDELVKESGPKILGGRNLQLNLARHAVTSADVWLYDERSAIAVLGDLVTLPVPFLDTACPEGWRAALEEISATPFRIAIPGHGPPMSPGDVRIYRQAFASFIECSNSGRPADDCGAGWVDGVRKLLVSDGHASDRVKAMAVDYVEMLRANGGRSRHCEMKVQR